MIDVPASGPRETTAEAAAARPAMPKITVVIAVYNGAATLEAALDSVTEQTHEDIEVVVIDGGSRYGTQRILEQHAGQIAYWESKPDRGIYHAWNKALDHVTGDWICFLGADDRYHAPDSLARMAAALAAADDRYRVAYGSVHIIRPDGTVRFSGFPWAKTRRRFLRQGRMIPHQGTFHRRDLFDDVGRFDEGYRIAGDYEFLLRELIDNEPLFVPDLVVVDMDGGGISYRRSSTYLLMREVHRARYTHGLTGSPNWRSFELFRTLTRIRLTRAFGAPLALRVKDTYRFIARKPRRRRNR